MEEEELIDFLYRAQGGRCAWCREDLDPDGRSIRLVRGSNRKGKWQLHHHPSESSRERTFGEHWEDFVPEIPINMRLVCLDCHDYPHGGKNPQDSLTH